MRLCLLAFLLIISGSFTSQSSILRGGYQMIPPQLSLEAYEFLLEAPGDLIKYLHLKNSILDLMIPMAVNVNYVLILKSYMKNIPEAVFESARLDGAGDWQLFTRIALP